MKRSDVYNWNNYYNGFKFYYLGDLCFFGVCTVIDYLLKSTILFPLCVLKGQEKKKEGLMQHFACSCKLLTTNEGCGRLS